MLEMRRVAHEQHVGLGWVRHPDEAGLVLQGGSHADAGAAVGVAVAVAAAHLRARHHFAHRHAGVLLTEMELKIPT